MNFEANVYHFTFHNYHYQPSRKLNYNGFYPYKLFGTGFASKATLVAINATAGYPAVLTWSAFGVGLSKIFSTPEKARILNGFLGVSLFAVAIWISLPN